MKPRFTDGHRFRLPYKPSHDTDIRKSMERRRKEIEAAQAQDAANKAEADAKVEKITRRKSA